MRAEPALTFVPVSLPTDAELENLEAQGTARSNSERVMFAPILAPPDPSYFRDRQGLVNAQIRTLGSSSAMLAQYVELLLRARRLTEFIHENVGDTEDWPVVLCSESEQTDALFARLIGDLEISVGLLTEV